jgi:glycine/serine hydroxymethyltransferase
VQEVTRRGFTEQDMHDLASYIDTAISTPRNIPQVQSMVIQKRLARNAIHYSFDDALVSASSLNAVGVAA